MSDRRQRGRELVLFLRSLRTGIDPMGRTEVDGVPCPRFGAANPCPETPNSLVREILRIAGQYTEFAGARIAILFAVEFAAEILRRKQENAMSELEEELRTVTVLTGEHCKLTEKAADIGGCFYGTVQDALERNLKFDIVLGNPPFGKDADGASWPYFFVQGFDGLLAEDGVMAMITPQTWMAPKDGSTSSPTRSVHEIIRKHAVALNLGECARHFEGIGSTFCYSVVTKAESGSVHIMTEDGEFDADPREVCDLMTRDVSRLSMDIMRKFRELPKREKADSPTPKGDMADKPDIRHRHRVWYSRSTVKWSDESHPLQYERKLIWHTQTAHDTPVYDHGVSVPCNRGAVFPVRDRDEADSILSLLRTAPMRFIISQQRYHHGFLNVKVVSESIPDVDYSRIWNDEDVAELLGLTEEEKDHIWTHLEDG